MIFLVLTSIVAVAYIIERGLALRWTKVIPTDVEDALVQSRNTDRGQDTRINRPDRYRWYTIQ